MPIVYIHGVNTRSQGAVAALEAPFRRWVAKAVNPQNPDGVGYVPIFWGDIAASFRWELASRPRTQILSGGAALASRDVGTARAAPRSLLAAPAASTGGGSVPAGSVIGGSVVAGESAAEQGAAPRPLSVAPECRADLLSDLYMASRVAAAEGVSADDLPSRLAALADEVAGLPAAAADVAETAWPQDNMISDAKLAEMLAQIDVRLTGVVGGGPGDWFARAGELARRAVLLPGDMVSTVFAEARPALNSFVANFIGDVLTYTHERGRGDAPGRIVRRVLDGLREAKRSAAGEPLVVVTHSMGGQLFYDAVVHFASYDTELNDLEVDHWISCGAQVSFFAELGQFIDQDLTVRSPAKLPRPRRVRKWTNFYDPNDLVGFVMQPVFDSVADREYNTGAGLALAHTAYLQRPSFFERMRDVIRG